ncbi:MAG: YeeE/YedE family protein, partial [Gammaproteobacteria bacterium]|nr:YeeE/YedE family protein [Gammaproteobacteria bacterium]
RSVAAAIGAELESVQIVLALVVALAIAVFCFSSAAFRQSPRNIVGGVLVGALVVAGWWATGVLAFDDFEPVSLGSLTFIAPVGDGVLYLMTFTGSTISFGIALVGGVIAGAFLAAKATKSFNLQGFANKSDLERNLIGAVLMGFGGVLALGCTIGQGVTGMSTLALGSFLALAAIIAGGVAGMRLMEALEG